MGKQSKPYHGAWGLPRITTDLQPAESTRMPSHPCGPSPAILPSSGTTPISPEIP